jgi:hypothetical protein
MTALLVLTVYLLSDQPLRTTLDTMVHPKKQKPKSRREVQTGDAAEQIGPIGSYDDLVVHRAHRDLRTATNPESHGVVRSPEVCISRRRNGNAPFPEHHTGVTCEMEV